MTMTPTRHPLTGKQGADSTLGTSRMRTTEGELKTFFKDFLVYVQNSRLASLFPLIFASQ